MFVEKLDTLLAYKAISLSAALSNTEKRVAAALIASFNCRTAQCDPSLGRIAKLLGVHRRTVIRALPKLETSGMFRKVRHGGKSHRNSYEPAWSRFRELDAQWKARFSEDKRARDTNLSLLQRQKCHLGDDEAVTQTLIRNQSEETYPKTSASRKPKAQNSSNGWEGHARVGRASAPRAGFHNRRTQTSSLAFAAARAAAERRWSTALHLHLAATPTEYGIAIETIDEALRGHATDAEMKRHGAGLAIVLTELNNRMRQEPAP